VKRLTQPLIYFPIALMLFMAPLSKADTAPPPDPPPVPSGYCTTISNELNSTLQAFNQVLATPPTWTPVPGGPTVYAANLQVADANTGPAISGSSYLVSVLPQLNEEKAMGAQAILLQIGFPALYAPFLGGTTQLAPYLTFYQDLAQAVRGLGMKLIVENDILLANDIQAGWPNLTSYFSTLSWNDYMQGRAIMAATIAETMQPDYLVLAEEPDTEASQSGQQNLLNPADAAQMIMGQISAVRTSSFPNVLLGAGFGSWPQANNPNSVAEYTAAYVQLPMDFIDSHIYPINTEAGGPIINNILTIASGAAAAGMPLAMSEDWVWKMENSELGVLSADNIRGRNPFSFWAPLDMYFAQTMQNLASYTNMLFVAGDGPDYLFTYQPFGGTTSNGGAANCTCTTQYCDAYDIIQTETQLAKTANQSAAYTTTGISFYNSMVPSPDTVAPSTPTSLTGTAAYTLTNLTWTASTDNVGVAGYNIYRCSPATLGGSCTFAQIAVSTIPSYTDWNLTQNTPYNYQVQAFDLANNNSPISPTLSLQTFRTAASAPTSITASPISASEISVSWTAPQDNVGLSKYLIFMGTSASNLVQVTTAGSTKTSYTSTLLSPGTTYYYGVEAVESGINSPMSPLVSTNTLALPDPPSNVTATATSPTQIVLSWQETLRNGLTIANYQVWQGSATSQIAKIATATSTTFTIRNLTPNTSYYYEIIAVDSGRDDSVPSPQVSVTTLPMPPAPTNLAATTPAATQIALTWQWSPLPSGLAAARYLVFCGTSPNNATQVGTATSQSYTYRSATAATTYYCYVEAVDTGNDNSAPTSQIVVTTAPMPNAPVNVSVIANANTRVTLSWTENLPANGLPISNYTIYRGTSPNNLAQVAIRTASPYVDTTVSALTTYYYAVLATDTGRYVSPTSGTASVTTP
jgi:fibronectin type 3 domain-containing protein